MITCGTERSLSTVLWSTFCGCAVVAQVVQLVNVGAIAAVQAAMWWFLEKQEKNFAAGREQRYQCCLLEAENVLYKNLNKAMISLKKWRINMSKSFVMRLIRLSVGSNRLTVQTGVNSAG